MLDDYSILDQKSVRIIYLLWRFIMIGTTIFVPPLFLLSNLWFYENFYSVDCL